MKLLYGLALRYSERSTCFALSISKETVAFLQSPKLLGSANFRIGR